jgi:hypothetical protein
LVVLAAFLLLSGLGGSSVSFSQLLLALFKTQ